jgi:hypothetical protein
LNSLRIRGLIQAFRGGKLLSKSIIYRFFRIDKNQLVKSHFSYWSSTSHPNYSNFETAVKLFDSKPLEIIETGSSAWGTDSTRLWDSYVSIFGGSCTSVDLSDAASKRLRFQLGRRTSLVVADSVDFLESYQGPKVDFAYLDSWDVNPREPLPAAIHGLSEFRALYPHLKSGSLVLVDDTPKFMTDEEYLLYPKMKDFKDIYGQTPGKGALILAHLVDFPEIEIVSHEYSLLIRRN